MDRVSRVFQVPYMAKAMLRMSGEVIGFSRCYRRQTFIAG
jgi:hypothetical protein